MKNVKTVLATGFLLSFGTAQVSAQADYDADRATANPDRAAVDERSQAHGQDRLSTTGDVDNTTTNTGIVDRTRQGVDRADIDPDLDPIDAEEFVETASAKGMAEIETGELALENGTAEVRDFATQMIEDHRQANQKLAELARQEGLEVSDEAGLIDKAKAMILQVRDGESFDEAYINNQIAAHEDTIELFERASISDNQAISSFAAETLPTLRMHLQEAQSLQSRTVSNR